MYDVLYQGSDTLLLLDMLLSCHNHRFEIYHLLSGKMTENTYHLFSCQALVPVQSSPVQVEGLGLSLWSLLPTTTTTTTANFSKFFKCNVYSIKSQKILSYIIIPTAHHHHHHHRKLSNLKKMNRIESDRIKKFHLIL